MAFWAVYGKYWFGRTGVIQDQIFLFKRYLFNEWYNSLSEEEKEKYDKKMKEVKEKKEKEEQKMLLDLMYLRRLFTH